MRHAVAHRLSNTLQGRAVRKVLDDCQKNSLTELRLKSVEQDKYQIGRIQSYALANRETTWVHRHHIIE